MVFLSTLAASGGGLLLVNLAIVLVERGGVDERVGMVNLSCARVGLLEIGHGIFFLPMVSPLIDASGLGRCRVSAEASRR